MKKRLNFTIDETTSELFRKICEDKSLNMSELVEGFMLNYIQNEDKYKAIKETMDNIDEIKNISIENYEKYSNKVPEIDLSNDTEDSKAKRLLGRINFSNNIIDFDTCRIGSERLILMSNKYSELFNKIIINDKIGDCYLHIDDILGDYIICMKLLSKEDIKIVEFMNNPNVYPGQLNKKNIEIKKHHVGFKIKS